jgi:hypothetical protein
LSFTYMVVPSLSWRIMVCNFYKEIEENHLPFPGPAAVAPQDVLGPGGKARRRFSPDGQPPAQNAPPLSLSYVCPEPVLAK